MKLIAIDPGSTQVGLYDGHKAATFELRRMKRSGVPDTTGRPERLANLAMMLGAALNLGYDYLVYEEQFVRGGAATKALFGAVGVIEAVAHSAGVGVAPIPQGALRKWSNEQLAADRIVIPEGKGADKLRLRTAAELLVPRDRFDVSKFTEHECDAAVLWHYAMQKGEVI